MPLHQHLVTNPGKLRLSLCPGLLQLFGSRGMTNHCLQAAGHRRTSNLGPSDAVAASGEGRNLSVQQGTGSTAPLPIFRRAMTPEPERPGRFGVVSHQAPHEAGRAFPQRRSLTQSDEIHLKTGQYQAAPAGAVVQKDGAGKPAAPSQSDAVGTDRSGDDEQTVCDPHPSHRALAVKNAFGRFPIARG